MGNSLRLRPLNGTDLLETKHSACKSHRRESSPKSEGQGADVLNYLCAFIDGLRLNDGSIKNQDSIKSFNDADAVIRGFVDQSI